MYIFLQLMASNITWNLHVDLIKAEFTLASRFNPSTYQQNYIYKIPVQNSDNMEEAIKNKALQQIFTDFAKFGNPKSDGKQITLTNADKWLKDAGITDGKKVTTTDTSIEFKKLKSKTIDFKQFLQFVEGLAKSKKIDFQEFVTKLAKSAPSTAGATTSDKSGVVERMTDTSKYTGSHKERFDAEGKGKGISGREDTTANDGYVQGYKNKDTAK